MKAPMNDAAVAALTAILLHGLKSIRSEHCKRKVFAKRLGVPPQTVVNIERGHRKLQAAELFVLAFAMSKTPEWVVQEICRRFEHEIREWRDRSGY